MPSSRACACARAASREPTATISTPPAASAPAASAPLMRAVESSPILRAMTARRHLLACGPLARSCSARSRLLAARQRVDGHGQQEHRAGDDELLARAEAEQPQPVVDREDDQSAEDRAL